MHNEHNTTEIPKASPSDRKAAWNIPPASHSRLPLLVLLGFPLLYTSLFVSIARAADTVVTFSGKSAALGSPYDRTKQDFLSQQCVSGSPTLTGSAEATLHLDQSMSEEEASESLGFGVGGHARFGVTDVSASAKFLSQSASSSYSVSAIYSAIYNFRTTKLLSVHRNTLGLELAPNFERWKNACGDSFVDEIRTGARLFFSIRVDFKSQKQKQEFEAEFSVSGPLAGAEGELKNASQRLGRDVKIVISAYQYGGDVSKLSEIFGGANGAGEPYLQCTLGHFEQCASVIQKALAYATNSTSGFPSQIIDKPADISYGVATYGAAGIDTEPYPTISELSEQSRVELSTRFEVTYKQYLTASRLLDVTPIQLHKSRLSLLKDILWSNLRVMSQSAKVCYETSEKCPDEVHSRMVLKEVNLALLQPPSFADVCVEAFSLPDGSPFRETLKAILMVNDLDLVDLGLSGDPASAPSYPRDCGKVSVQNITRLDLTDDGEYVSPEGLVTRLSVQQILDDPESTEHEKWKAQLVLSQDHWLQHSLNLTSPVSDLSPLIALPNLSSVNIQSHRISDLTVLATLPYLETLILVNDHITDASFLSGLTNLRSLVISNNQISELPPFLAKNLLSLDVSNNNLKEITWLSRLDRLMYLAAMNNLIEDIGIIDKLPELTIANFHHNAINSLDSLSCAVRLKELIVTENFIRTDSVKKFCERRVSPCDLSVTLVEDNLVHMCAPKAPIQ